MLFSSLLGIYPIALGPITLEEKHNITSSAVNSSDLFIIYRPLTNSTNQNRLDYQHHNINSSSIVVWVNEASLNTITRSIPAMVAAVTREGKNTISFSFLKEDTSKIVIASTLQSQQQGITHDAFLYDQHSCQMVRNCLKSDSFVILAIIRMLDMIKCNFAHVYIF